MSFVVSVRLSIHLHGTSRFPLCRFFWKSVAKFQLSLKLDNNNRYFTFLIYLTQFFLEWEMFWTKVVEKSKTHILCSISWLFLRKCGKILSSWAGNRWQYGTCVLHAGYSLRICNNYCFSTATVVARTHLTVTLYVHWLSCFTWFHCISLFSMVISIVCQ